MRLARVPFTIQRLMVFFAMTAVSIGGLMAISRYLETRRLAKSYAAKASYFADLEEENTRTADDCEEFLNDAPRPEECDAFLEGKAGRVNKARSNFAYNTLARRMCRAVDMRGRSTEREAFMASTRAIVSRVGPHSRRDASYYASLKSKYERAASRPWEPVAADLLPPEP
jgi:hypothetical protein